MVTLDQGGAGARSVRLVPPSRELRGRVQHLLVETLEQNGSEALRGWRIVADHCPHLLYHRDGAGEAHRLILVGPRSVAVDIDKRDRIVTAGVRLQPWALPALFDVAAVDVADQGVALVELFGGRASALADELAVTPAAELPSVFERWLAPRASRVESRAERHARFAARLLLAATKSCGATASELGISSRRLHTLMCEQIGLSPSTFGQICRLHDALERAQVAGRDVTWAAIAAATGFSDQAHLIRAFRHFLGETPRAWAERSSAVSVR